MVATISSITSSGKQGALAVITGSGFGAAQGGSLLLFQPNENGVLTSCSIVAWAATEITTTVPTTAAVSPPDGYFIVVLEGDTVGVSYPITVLEGDPSPVSTYSFGDVVQALPGALGTPALGGPGPITVDPTFGIPVGIVFAGADPYTVDFTTGRYTAVAGTDLAHLGSLSQRYLANHKLTIEVDLPS